MKDGVTNSVSCGFWKSQRVCTNEKWFPLWFCPINSIWIVVFRQQFRLDLGVVGFDSGEFSPVGSKTFLHKTVSKIISEITDRLFYLKVRLIPPTYFMKIDQRTGSTHSPTSSPFPISISSSGWSSSSTSPLFLFLFLSCCSLKLLTLLPITGAFRAPLICTAFVGRAMQFGISLG